MAPLATFKAVGHHQNKPFSPDKPAAVPVSFSIPGTKASNASNDVVPKNLFGAPVTDKVDLESTATKTVPTLPGTPLPLHKTHRETSSLKIAARIVPVIEKIAIRPQLLNKAYVFISAWHVDLKVSNIGHIGKMVSEHGFSPLAVRADATGYYIVFGKNACAEACFIKFRPWKFRRQKMYPVLFKIGETTA